MKEGFVEYLGSVDMAEILIARVRTIYEFYQTTSPCEIEDIFVSEYINDQGQRVYESLWFFAQQSYMEAKQFASQDDFDFMRGRLIRWQVQKHDYDFDSDATIKSRLALRFQSPSGVSGNLKASGKNCEHLKSIMVKYVIPNTG